jgi:sorting nexin-13
MKNCCVDGQNTTIQNITASGRQTIFLSMHLTGWRVSAEQQISDIELQKLKSGGDGRQAKGQIPNPTLDNMKEAAYSIYEQYLSEKVKLRCRTGS